MIDLFEIIHLQKEVDKTYAIDLSQKRNFDKISIQSDMMFKAMFQNENRLKYPKLFLELLFSMNNKLDFENLKFAKNETDKRNVLDKEERCDFIASLGKIYFNIEVNNNSNIEIMERNIEYAYRIYSGKIKKGTNYFYSPVIQININNFSFKENNKTVDIFYTRNDDDIALTDKLTFIMVYVPNIIKKCYNEGTKSLTDFERFILVLALENNEKCYEIARGDKIMEEYINEASEVSFDYSLGESYDHRQADIEEAIKDGKIEGKKEGKKEGRKEAILEITKEMLNRDIDEVTIAQITKLSIDQIKDLKNNNF